MEDVLDTYEKPYDPRFPVLCMDESCKQLLDETRPPIPAKPGTPARMDDEYIRCGAAQIFLAVEPLTRKTIIHIGETRTRKDWAQFMKTVIDSYPNAERIHLVMDNLNTHTCGSFYEAFPPEEARALAAKLEIHYTPKHGSWLNVAEIELSCLKRGCFKERMASQEIVQKACDDWLKNRKATKINWRFTAPDARIKLKKLYPNFKP